jgi:hypothetical protein
VICGVPTLTGRVTPVRDHAGRADLVQANGDALAWLLAGVSAPTVGAVLAARRPRHPVGWLLRGLGTSLGLTFLTDGYALYGLLARPGSLRWSTWWR